MTIYEDAVLLPLQVVTTGNAVIPDNTLTSDLQRCEGAGGLVVTLTVTARTSGTAAVRLIGIEMFEGTEYQVNVDATVASVSRFVWIFNAGASKTPPGEGAATTSTAVIQVVGVPIPDRYKLRVAKSDASSWTLALAARRVP